MNSGNRVVIIFVMLAILTGIASHLSLVLRSSEMLADRPFRDDGFYALTVSRNLAMGKGLSVSDGEIPTNGIQPLFVYLCSLPFFLGQDRLHAIRLVQVLNLIVHILSTLALFHLVRRFTQRKTTPWVASALWAASYGILKFSSNGLETGLYFLMIICTVQYYLKLLGQTCTGTAVRPVQSLLFGALLGILTLTRIDAGILVMALAIHYLWYKRSSGFFKTLLQGPFLWFLAWIATTLPWWLYNIHLTGNPLPISGLVQTMYRTTNSYFHPGELLVNSWYAANVVLDYVLFAVLTPLRLIRDVTPGSILITAVKFAALAAVVLFVYRKRERISIKTLLPWKQLAFYPLFILGLLIFYIFFFNVEWYMNRYLSPMAIGSAVVLSMLLEKLKPFWTAAMLGSVILFTVAVSLYSYPRRFNTMYEYHWGWVRENLAPDTWVAASQSGTLGYFHDRTINTDGKVNSELYFVEHGQVGTYLAGRSVEYFLEWKESYVFRDSSFLELFEYDCDFGLCQVWRRAEAN